MGKINNQSSVSNADREIPTLGSTDNAGNEVNLVPALSVYPRFGIALSASETDDRFYLYHIDNAKLVTRLYDKRNDINFSEVNLPFLPSNFLSEIADGVYESEFVRYAKAYSAIKTLLI